RAGLLPRKRIELLRHPQQLPVAVAPAVSQEPRYPQPAAQLRQWIVRRFRDTLLPKRFGLLAKGFDVREQQLLRRGVFEQRFHVGVGYARDVEFIDRRSVSAK